MSKPIHRSIDEQVTYNVIIFKLLLIQARSLLVNSDSLL